MKKVIQKLVIVLALISVLFFLTSEKGYITAKMQGYKALKVFAHVKSSELTHEFNMYETKHFIIKYSDRDEDIVRDIGRIFEKSYDVEGQHYKHYPEEKTIVFLYRDQKSMWDYQQSVNGQAVMGLYNMGIIHVLSPKAYLSETQISARDFEKNGPVLHEYVHKVIDDKSGGNIELWLTEGLALYEEYTVDGVEWAEGFSYDMYYSADELRNDFMGLDATKSYRQSFDIVKSLIDVYGRERMLELLNELKAGNSLDEAFYMVYGKDINEHIDSEDWKV